jgi:membrane flanked domain protein
VNVLFIKRKYRGCPNSDDWYLVHSLTNKRLIAKAGFIRRQTIELNIDRAESLSVIQGFWGRIFNYGSIVIRGTGGSHAPIPYIARPMEFRQQFNDFIDNEKSN